MVRRFLRQYHLFITLLNKLNMNREKNEKKNIILSFIHRFFVVLLVARNLTLVINYQVLRENSFG